MCRPLSYKGSQIRLKVFGWWEGNEENAEELPSLEHTLAGSPIGLNFQTFQELGGYLRARVSYELFHHLTIDLVPKLAMG